MKTIRVANSHARPYVEARRAFVGTNIRGRVLGPARDSYAVFSYTAPIFIWGSGIWFEDVEQYGTIMTRHRKQLAPSDQTILLPCEDMHKMAEDLEDGVPPEVVALNAIASSLPKA